MSSLRMSDPFFSDPFESAVRRIFTPSLFESDMPSMRIPVDVAEQDGTYHVVADLPGVKKEDINVRIDGNLVQIDAQTSVEKDATSGATRILRNERYHGSISRTFSMAEDIDDKRVLAKYLDGVLTLELPKKKSSEMRKIAVH
jgi:HSP20 family protein